MTKRTIKSPKGLLTNEIKAVRERNPVHGGWLYAILVAQEKGDLAPLAQLLRHKEFDLGRGERLILAMLFDRFRLAKKRGAQRTPIGKVSERDKLEIMAKDVRDIASWARGDDAA